MSGKPYEGKAEPIGPLDILEVASSIGVPEVNFRTLLVVETGSGGGFLDDGRPKILYEAHVAHRLCGVHVPGLSVPKWDRTLYAPTGRGEYDRLERAVAHPSIGLEVALKACSWGSGQVLGVNHRMCGYEDVTSFVRAMADSGRAQLKAVAEFLRTRGLAETLTGGDWSRVAEGYNGTQYRLNAYDVKLAHTNERLRRSDDGRLGLGDQGPDVRALQDRLAASGATLKSDGDFGRHTQIALEQFQEAAGLPSGLVDEATCKALGLPWKAHRPEHQGGH